MVKPDPKTVDFDVSKAVNYVLDENRPIELRAIRLFELQVAIAAGLKPEEGNDKDKKFRPGFVSVPLRILASANIVASVKVLEALERRIKTEHGSKYKSNILFKYKVVRSIFRRILLTPQGLRKLRYSQRPKQFDVEIQKITKVRRRIAPAYDYSARFIWDPQFPKIKGGITNAIKILCRVKKDPAHKIVRRHYEHIYCKSDIKEYKKRRDYLAGFCWLEYFNEEYFRPQKTRTRLFAANLLAQAANIDGLRRYIAQYGVVRSRLTAQGYKLLELELSSPLPPVELSFSPLPEDIRKLKPSVD
jgi:hypothetical protein